MPQHYLHPTSPSKVRKTTLRPAIVDIEPARGRGEPGAKCGDSRICGRSYLGLGKSGHRYALSSVLEG
jgi:hypothetical protein